MREILVTRPEPGAAATARRLTDLGYTPILAPLTTIEPCPTLLPDPTAIDAVLITSGNAVAHMPPAFRGLPTLTVGDATAAQARAAGFADVRSADGDATDLAALAGRVLPRGSRLLFATAAGQGHPLTAALRAAGFFVHRRTVYAAQPVAALPEAAAAALGGGNLQAALFLSAEAARVFARLLPGSLHPALGGVEALAIGPPVAAALAPLPWRRVRVSLRPTHSSVLSLL